MKTSIFNITGGVHLWDLGTSAGQWAGHWHVVKVNSGSGGSAGASGAAYVHAPQRQRWQRS